MGPLRNPAEVVRREGVEPGSCDGVGAGTASAKVPLLHAEGERDEAKCSIHFAGTGAVELGMGGPSGGVPHRGKAAELLRRGHGGPSSTEPGYFSGALGSTHGFWPSHYHTCQGSSELFGAARDGAPLSGRVHEQDRRRMHSTACVYSSPLCAAWDALFSKRHVCTLGCAGTTRSPTPRISTSNPPITER